MQKLLARLFPFIQEALTFKEEAQKLLKGWMDYGMKHADDPKVQSLVNDTKYLLDKLSQKVGRHG